MTYRNSLLGTYNFNGNQILSFIQDWVSSGPRIKVGAGGEHVRIDSSCVTAIFSLDEPECGLRKDGCLTFGNDLSSFGTCAEHQLGSKRIANCFNGCLATP